MQNLLSIALDGQRRTGSHAAHGATMTDYTGLLRVHSLSAALVTTNLAQRPGRRFMDGK
jgi:hypothetical protein